MNKVILHTDCFDTNGKEFMVKAFNQKQGSSAITLEVIENPWTTRSITVPISEVEWLDEI